ncbi:MAG: TonB-dependent receptor [Pseudomonadota bacterium]
MSHRNTYRDLFAGTASAVALGFALSTSAIAQDDDVIVVTATKKEENIQDVPLSVAVVSGEKLDVLGSGGLDVRFLSARVPSLQIESSFGRTFPRFYIRGLGNTDFDLNASQPVSLVYDNVILENPIVKGFPVFDLDRVEVLRGPQGTLFGRNTPAGIVKFDSAKPTRELEGYGQISYGRFNAVNWEGALSGPLSDTLSARVSTLFQRRDDWVDNLAPGFEQEDALEGFNEFAGRGQLLWEPTENFSVLGNVHGRRLRGTARLFRANIATGDGDELPETLTVNQLPLMLPSGTQVPFERDQVFVDSPNFQNLNSYGGIIEMNWDMGQVTLTSISGYETAELSSRGDIDGGTGDFLEADFLENVLMLDPTPMGPGFIPFRADTADAIPDLDQFTQEIRLSSNDWERINWQLGFFYFTEEVDIVTEDFGDEAVTPGADTPVAVGLQNQETDSWAVFGSVDIDVTDRFNLRGGVRYTDEQKDFTASRPIDTRPGFLLFGGPFTPDPVSTDDGVVTWDVSATFAVDDMTNLYARVARGFRAPSIQGRIAFFQIDPVTMNDPQDSISVADTETILSYEAGVKSTILGGAGRVNLNGFYYEIDNQQLTAVGGGGNFNTALNADETIGYGFEFDMDWRVTEQFEVTVGASYNYTEIQDPDLTVAGCGSQQCTILDPFTMVADPTALPPVNGLPGMLSIVNVDGNPLPQAPRWIANWTARYGVPFFDGELFVFTDWALRSRVNFFLYESLEFRDNFLIEGGLRAGYVWNDGKHEIAAFGRNITNDQSLTGGIDFNNQVGFINEPPIWGVEFRGSL